MTEITGMGWTQGQQGGIGYPPLIVKYKNKWWFVEGSRNHGGTICFQCSRDKHITYGYEPGGFAEQPRAFGSVCYRSLIPKAKTYPTRIPRRSLSWEQFVTIVKTEYGEPNVLIRQFKEVTG